MTHDMDATTQAMVPVAPTRGRLRPLGHPDVRIAGGFWAERQRINAEATLEHCQRWIHRAGWIDNFRVDPGHRRGREFSDADVYKVLEAMAWETGRSGAPGLRDELDRLGGVIGAAQAPDGYLNTRYGRRGQPPRYSDLEWGHELYNYGFLIQAAVAQIRVFGSGGLVDVARRAADHVVREFGRAGIDGVCGHAEIEMALAELARATGDQRYLDQAALFVDRRGRGRLADIEFGRAYFQDDEPVRAAEVLRGHAVRALYLASGAVDVAVETGDDALLEAVQRQWEATVARRTYITGGMGSHHMDEAFGDDFELPPDRAYSETCAGVASVMLSWRLLLATGDPRYADLAERTLFNVVATSPATDGRSFFYANTLHQRRPGAVPPADEPSPRAASSLRAPWFAVSCCPTNVARTLASLDAYVATADDEGVQIHQYAESTIRTVLGGGRAVALTVHTSYPEDGEITVEVTEAPGGPWAVSLRVPGWASSGAVLADPAGRIRPVAPGMVRVEHAFAAGDRVTLRLPVAPRWVTADPRIDAVRGSAAVERGPVVFCVESSDLPDKRSVDAIRVDTRLAPTEPVGEVLVTGRLVEPTDHLWPFAGDSAPEPEDEAETTEITLIPYHAWANRGPSTMRVWLPVWPS